MRGEGRLAAQFRIQGIVVHDVVAVRAAGTCLQPGGSVHMADTEACQVRRQRGGIVEAEALIELQPVCGPRNHLDQRTDHGPKRPSSPGSPSCHSSGARGGLGIHPRTHAGEVCRQHRARRNPPPADDYGVVRNDFVTAGVTRDGCHNGHDRCATHAKNPPVPIQPLRVRRSEEDLASAVWRMRRSRTPVGRGSVRDAPEILRAVPFAPRPPDRREVAEEREMAAPRSTLRP